MSNQVYNDLWRRTQHDLELIVIADFENQACDGQTDRKIAQAELFELYLKYIVCGNQLEEIYDQMVQPQKRLLICRLLDACLSRVIELKHDLVNIDLMEFNYNDEVVAKLNLMPGDMETRIPRFIQRTQAAEIEHRRKTIDDILIKLGWMDEEVADEKMTELEAIKIIQMHERGRQGRLRAQFMKEIKMLKEKGKPDGLKERTQPGVFAAMRIQKMWRGFAERRITRRRKHEEMILIGMTPAVVAQQTEKIDQIDEIQKHRYELQKTYEDNYTVALLQIKEEIKSKQGARLTEEIADEIRLWIQDFNLKSGKFPEFPSEENGGSRYLLSRQGTDSELSRSSAVSSKESKKTKDNSKSSTVKDGVETTAENLESGIFKATQSLILPDIKAAIDEYNEVWNDKDETLNPRQFHYDDMIYVDKYAEVEKAQRNIVDNTMRQELEVLQAALDRDRAAKGKRGKKSSKKTRRSGKKGKKKKEKDLTPDRSPESLFEELVANGIIKRYPETLLKTYLGDRSYVARSGLNPTPGDIRQLIIEYCILPLGSKAIRNATPCVRSLLLAGPRGSGKKSLVHAICTETGAILFDLTPSNIVGKYPGKTGLIMLVHLVSKVSRLFQPAVIYMDDAEKPFMKKIPKTDRSDPKRLKKDLPKMIKNIASTDQIVFIGTSKCPWEADQKLFQQAYTRFVYTPRPDYGVLSFVWQNLLSQFAGTEHFDTGAMAKISDGYTIGSVVKCIKSVITCKRMLQLRMQPLTHAELINALSVHDPVYREEEDSYELWWSKTPLGRRQQKMIELEAEAKLETENANAKGKQKKN